MYLHAGANVIIRKKNIIGIFDIDNMNTEEIMKEFLRNAEKNGRTITAGEVLPKAFILVNDGESDKIIFSQISATRLCARATGNDERTSHRIIRNMGSEK